MSRHCHFLLAENLCLLLTYCFSGLLFLPGLDVEYGAYEVDQDIVPEGFVTQIICQPTIRSKYSLTRLDACERGDEVCLGETEPIEASGARFMGLKFRFCCILAVWFRPSYLTSLCLSFLCHKIGVMIIVLIS